jgi:A/G-specific adenine glycosylase
MGQQAPTNPRSEHDDPARIAAPIRRRKRTGTPARPSAERLLAWYDLNRRYLPWRVQGGERPDPYRVWLSEIMLQQTTVAAVAPYFARFVARWPDLRSLAKAPLEEVLRLWAGLGYYARARNLHACSRTVVEHHSGRFPNTEAALAKLPGIGKYTAAAIAAIAYDARTVPVDGNIERVVARLFAVEDPLPAAKPLIRKLAQSLVSERRSGDFAQGLMDLGSTVCTPKRPGCGECPWSTACLARQHGSAERLPARSPRREGRGRSGAAFVALRTDGFVLVRSRPARGLLGGMTEVPTSEWTADFTHDAALAQAPLLERVGVKWQRVPGVVHHVFTHFPLDLFVYSATVAARTRAPPGARWLRLSDIPGEAFPSLMRKVLAHVLAPGA